MCGMSNGCGVNRKMRVAVNSEIKYKADLKTDRRAAKSLTYNYTLFELTLDELADKIRERCNITSTCIDASARFHRKAENFRASCFAGVDVDNDRQEYFSLEDALAHPFIKEHGGIVYNGLNK
jgi:hypothetical protein